MTVRPVSNTGQVLAYLPGEHPAVLSEPAFITHHLPDGDSASWGSASTWSSVAAEGHVLRATRVCWARWAASEIPTITLLPRR